MEDSGSRLPARQDFPHLSDAHWATLEKMVSLLGEAAFAGFPDLPAEQQRGRVERFDKYESSLIAHVSAAAREAARATMRAEAQSAAQASATNTAAFAARPTTTKPVKMSVPTFDGKDSDSQVFWDREIEITLSAGQNYDARTQVAFALSNLAGRARAWTMGRETATPGYFTSWSLMEQGLRSIFPLADVAYRHRSNFLRCKQGKRSLQDYVMELHNLEAAMAGAPLSEDVKVTVFMDGVRTGPVRTELFRRQPKPFNEAVHIAMLEGHFVRSAQDHAPHVEASEGPTPMEVSLAESARPQRTPRAGGRCFGCNQPGHFRRNCPTNPWKVTRDKKHSVSPSSTSPKEQVPGTTLLYLSVVAARSNLVVVTASVKGYPEPMTVLIDSGASFNFATKASVARNNALYASALEASKSNTNVSVRLATGSIVSTRNVTILLSVKFDDFNSIQPFIVLDMDDRYDLILGMPWLAKHEPWIDWRSRTIGAGHYTLVDRALAVHVPSSSRDGFVHEHCVPRANRQFAGSSEVLQLPTASLPRARELEVGDGKDPQDPRTPPIGRQGSADCNRVASIQGTVTSQGADAAIAGAGKGGSVRAPPTQSVVAGSAHVEECAGVVARANKSGRVGAPTTQGVVAGSARATEDAGPWARATTSGRAGAPTSKAIKGDKVTSTPKAEESTRDADSAAEYRVPQVVDAFTGEPKVGEALTPLPTVAELLELEELSYVEVLDSLKAGELAEVVLFRPEGGAMEFNSSSVMDSEVLEDERTSKRQTRYGAAILKDPSDSYHPLLKEFSDVVSDDPPSILPPDRGIHEIDLVPGTKYFQVATLVPDWVRKPNGKWRMVHAFNKLNAATIPASTPIPRKVMLQNNMAGCTVFSALDTVDGYYQLLMRESDIPLTAVSTPSGILWEWLVMPQGLSNAPATFNGLVTQLFRPMRHFVQTYFDDIFVHSRTSEGKTAVEAHLGHLREVLLCMRENHHYANINKCIFGAEEISVLGCFLGKDGVRANPEKVCAIAQWPVSVSQKDLRKWLGLANYLHKYSANYAALARPLTNLLKKDAVWSWTSEAQQAFDAIKSSLQSAPILALPDEDRSFSVVCDASDFAIGCDLLQVDAEGRESVVSFQSHQLKAVEKNYPVHDKELLAMKYALVKFRVHLLGQKPFVIYTYHASLRTATSSPHLSQRMARWLSFFAEYNFTVEYKPGKQNVLADALCRRPDYELAHLAYLESPLYELIREAYAGDDDLAGLVAALSVPNKTVGLTERQRSRLHRYSVVEGLLYYQVDGGDEPRIVVPNDEDLRHRVLYEAHDTPRSGHLGREKTYTSVARNFWWSHIYKWRPMVRVPLLATPLPPPRHEVGHVHSGHPQTDGQTEWVNRVLEDFLRSVCAAEPTKWSTLLPQVEFALNNAVHSSTGFTPFYVPNGLRHPRTPLTLPPPSNLGGGEANAEDPRGLTGLRTSVKRNLLSFIETGEAVRQRVRDAMAAVQDTQKEQSDRQGRKNTQVF
ncbi:unnamed protein product [Phytophthora fragariaefolia]|uniref:Unnamed protein product n=3 Tax=Phytophthora TaxID=4783 RepID=A0A9W6U8E7_9STRA|nr:unnamed protein product [Phytophthora fragariaefolia]